MQLRLGARSGRCSCGGASRGRGTRGGGLGAVQLHGAGTAVAPGTLAAAAAPAGRPLPVRGSCRGLAPRRQGSSSSHPPPASYDFSFVVAVTRVCFLVCCLRCFPAAPALRPPPPSLWFNLPLSPSVLCTANYVKICISSPLPAPHPRPHPHLLEKQNPTSQNLSGPEAARRRGADLWSGSRWPIAVLGAH